TEDAVVGDRRVGDIRAREPRHVAGGAVVALFLPCRGRQTARACVPVAAQATAPVVSHLPPGVGKPVRVMTRYAAQPAVAPQKTPAGVHLLDVPDRLPARP